MDRIEKNPWIDLPSAAPFVVNDDAEKVEAFNRTASESHRYHLELLPEPFLGVPTAPIVLLNLNPGYDQNEERFHHLDEYFQRVSLLNLAHEGQDYPFYFLEPGKRSPGHVWWQQRLRELTDLYGNRVVARNLLCLEFFPYHSISFGNKTPKVPSQQYTFTLLRAALKRNAVVIAMRAFDKWIDNVPELRDYDVHRLNSQQAVYVTAKNCPTGFAEATARLRKL